MAPDDAMRRIDQLFSHIWMVRTFLKHSEEAQEDDELAEVHRELYDCMLALGAPLQAGDSALYLRQARKKLSKLRRATEQFLRIQPKISQHTNFKMAALSLEFAVNEITAQLASLGPVATVGLAEPEAAEE